MKNKRLAVPAILLVVGIVLTVAAYLLTAIIKVPAVTEQDFDYAVTYTLNGETKTLEGVYRARFQYENLNTRPYERQYAGYYLTNGQDGRYAEHVIEQKDGLDFCIVFCFTSDYLMGDSDNEEYAAALAVPYLAAYDQSGVEYVDEETMAKLDAEIVSWEAPEPIENTFVFDGFSMLHEGSMAAMLVVGLLMIVACMIFVKKDQDITYNMLDKVSVVLNFLVTLAAIPVITLIVCMMQIYINVEGLVYQLHICLPAFTAFTVAASIALRRKGFRKTGFVIQFAGPVLFLLHAWLEEIGHSFFL